MTNPYALSSYQFALPEELIAQYPCTPRDHARLMVIERKTGNISEIQFKELPTLLQAEDHLIFNDTRVIPARLIGKRATGGECEIFLVRRLPDDSWEALAKPGKKLRVGDRVRFSEEFSCEILETLENGNKRVSFDCRADFDTLLMQHGQIPLPPYIQRAVDSADAERYQTVYATQAGAIAAPTAGLHFTHDLLEKLKSLGVHQTTLTLHVGLGTFRPVQTEDIRQHQMHAEQFIITPQAAAELNQHKEGRRKICVGTTTCRALESAWTPRGIDAGEYNTNIFIYPGYHFKYVEALLTNFHLPGSSLLMLVSAFAGYDLTMEAYARAVRERYRFFSYGDAMLIL